MRSRLLLLATLSVPALLQAQDAAPNLDGTFTLAESREDVQTRINTAIDAATEEMNFILRGIARDRLRAKNPVRVRLTTQVAGDRIVVSYDNDRYESQSGQWRSVTATGETVQLLQQIQGNRIYQTFRTADGEKRMVLTFSEDGAWVWLDVTVTSSRIPAPLRYRMRFRRQQAG